jgi:hypothetical protein
MAQGARKRLEISDLKFEKVAAVKIILFLPDGRI